MNYMEGTNNIFLDRVAMALDYENLKFLLAKKVIANQDQEGSLPKNDGNPLSVLVHFLSIVVMINLMVWSYVRVDVLDSYAQLFHLKEKLEEISEEISNAWLSIGDFNIIFHDFERIEGVVVFDCRVQRNSCPSSTGLICLTWVVKLVSHTQINPIRLCRGSPQLSHLTLVDDLVLLGEASLELVEIIASCLEPLSFCKEMDKKCISFLWGILDRIYVSKEKDGLGLRKGGGFLFASSGSASCGGIIQWFPLLLWRNCEVSSLANRRGGKYLVVEIDSIMAFNQLQKWCHESHPCAHLDLME
ncbi:hypothetical protein RJT34_01091 [Clitoria ternatea]|uniref:Uncharacterized protein n=1 Tax=Clitoria ternatea TaxID=43366 RepID=A0AAN9KJ62_CLITE